MSEYYRMARQLAFDVFEREFGVRSPLLQEAVETLAGGSGSESQGRIFTRPEIVTFILDLVGYTINKSLYEKRILEPAFGGGEFLFEIVRRLLRAWRQAGEGDRALCTDLKNSVRGVELHHKTFEATRESLIMLLRQENVALEDAKFLVDQWLVQDDFLLTAMDGQFDFVVGNPPYVRQEAIPAPLLAEYRRRYSTMYDRADLYVPFIERSLRLLEKEGALGFICADRWIKNRYGGPLRKLVAEQFHLKIFVDMFNTPAFQSEVSTYPAITIITREESGITRIAQRPAIHEEALRGLSDRLRAATLPESCDNVRELQGVTNGSEPWLLESSEQMKLIRRLEKQFPRLEQVGCKVGIGVATGADQAFIGDFDALDVEPDRKLPLVTTEDVLSGKVCWQGLGIINPFTEGGELVALEDYPRLRRYLEARREIIAGRYCARRSPQKWYRTIDRIVPSLTTQRKLLIPDIKGEAHVVYEEGRFYPHHNLYYITSKEWDLRALQAVLLSSIAHLFIVTYSIKMRGGFLRFQAQYLRRIRLPLWESVDTDLRSTLVKAALSRDRTACDHASFELYNLSQEERYVVDDDGG